MVQTGPKIQLGGFKGPFVKPAYQVGMDGVVNRAPMTPANSVMIIERMNLITLLVFIDLFFIKISAQRYDSKKYEKCSL